MRESESRRPRRRHPDGTPGTLYCGACAIDYDVRMCCRTTLTLLLTAIVATGCESPSPVGSASAERVDDASSRPATSTVTFRDPTPSVDTRLPSAGRTEPVPRASQTSGDETPPADVAAFRPPDVRPRHDAARLAEHGIRPFESRRLLLYTDIEPEAAASLPKLLDALFDEWEAYFGRLPPARDGSEFQLTGYLMRNQQPFRDAGLLPVNLPVFAHGKHNAQQFWMNDQQHPYYRRHLLFHEATHCFMQAMGGTTEDVPVWYLEGMAELFATHELSDGGTPTFRVIPAAPEDFVGFSRIEVIERDIEEGDAFSLAQLTSLTPRQFQQRQSPYAWSWMTCLLADRNPNYRDAFRELGRRYPGEGFAHVRGELFDPLTADFTIEWTLLARTFDYGQQIEAAAITFEPGQPLPPGGEQRVEVAAERGWQSSGIEVSPQNTYAITADGQVTLADNPKPWVSEPPGITIRYADGRPIGQLLGLVIGDSQKSDTPEGTRYLGEVLPIGRGITFTPQETGTLYLRVNDFGSELTDNSGEYRVTVRLGRPE